MWPVSSTETRVSGTPMALAKALVVISWQAPKEKSKISTSAHETQPSTLKIRKGETWIWGSPIACNMFTSGWRHFEASYGASKRPKGERKLTNEGGNNWRTSRATVPNAWTFMKKTNGHHFYSFRMLQPIETIWKIHRETMRNYWFSRLFRYSAIACNSYRGGHKFSRSKHLLNSLLGCSASNLRLKSLLHIDQTCKIFPFQQIEWENIKLYNY